MRCHDGSGEENNLTRLPEGLRNLRDDPKTQSRSSPDGTAPSLFNGLSQMFIHPQYLSESRTTQHSLSQMALCLILLQGTLHHLQAESQNTLLIKANQEK